MFRTAVILTTGTWKAGREPRAMTPDPVDPVDPRMSSKSCKFVAPASKNEQGVAIARWFFTFLGMSHAKPYVFLQFLDSCLPEMVAKPMVSLETSLKKSKNVS